MKSRRILAAVLAPVVAISSTAIIAVAANTFDIAPKYDSKEKQYVPNVGAYAKIDLTKPDNVNAADIATVRVVVKSTTVQDVQWLGAEICGSPINDANKWVEGGYVAPTKDQDGYLVFDCPLTTEISAAEVDWNNTGIAFKPLGGTSYDNAISGWADTPDNPVQAIIVKVEFLDKDSSVLGSEEYDTGYPEIVNDGSVLLFTGITPLKFGENGASGRQVQIENEALKTAKAGDTIVIAMTKYGASPVLQLASFVGTGWEWKLLPGMASVSGYTQDNTIPIDSTSETFTYTLQDGDVEAINMHGKLVIAGQQATVKSVRYYVSKSDPETSETPDTPDTPDTPNTPDTPTTPEKPDVTPGGSDKPKIPPAPSSSGNTSGGNTSSGSTSSDTSKDDASSDNSSTANVPEGIEVIKTEVKGVDSQKGVEGAALNEQILVKDGKKYTWKDVESVTFTSDKLFCVAFSTKEELAGTTWFTMGKDKIPTARADEAPQWATSWTIGADELALFDTDKEDYGFVKLIAKEDGTDISVSVNVRKEADAPADDTSSTGSSDGTTSKPADSTGSTGNNPSTGIAIAAAPLALAGAFAVVTARKKRK